MTLRGLGLGAASLALLGLFGCTDGQDPGTEARPPATAVTPANADPAGAVIVTPAATQSASNAPEHGPTSAATEHPHSGAESTLAADAHVGHEHNHADHASTEHPHSSVESTSAVNAHAGHEHNHAEHTAADAGHEHHPAAHSATSATNGAAARLLQAYSNKRLAAETLAAFRELGADLEAVDAAAETVLIHAARSGDVAWVEALVAAGARLEHRDHHGWSALNHAINANQPEVALALLKAGAAADVADMHANTPLQYAVNLNADARVVAALVAAGADVNRLSQHGHSVLMEALDAGNPPELIEALLQAPGIQLDYVDREGMDARAHAEATGEPAVLALFPPLPGASAATPTKPEAPTAEP